MKSSIRLFSTFVLLACFLIAFAQASYTADPLTASVANFPSNGMSLSANTSFSVVLSSLLPVGGSLTVSLTATNGVKLTPSTISFTSSSLYSAPILITTPAPPALAHSFNVTISQVSGSQVTNLPLSLLVPLLPIPSISMVDKPTRLVVGSSSSNFYFTLPFPLLNGQAINYEITVSAPQCVFPDPVPAFNNFFALSSRSNYASFHTSNECNITSFDVHITFLPVGITISNVHFATFSIPVIQNNCPCGTPTCITLIQSPQTIGFSTAANNYLPGMTCRFIFDAGHYISGRMYLNFTSFNTPQSDQLSLFNGAMTNSPLYTMFGNYTVTSPATNPPLLAAQSTGRYFSIVWTTDPDDFPVDPSAKIGWSALVQFVSLPAFPFPPTNVYASQSLSNSSITINWSPPATALPSVAGYRVFINSLNSIPVADTTSTTATLTVPAVFNGGQSISVAVQSYSNLFSSSSSSASAFVGQFKVGVNPPPLPISITPSLPSALSIGQTSASMSISIPVPLSSAVTLTISSNEIFCLVPSTNAITIPAGATSSTPLSFTLSVHPNCTFASPNLQALPLYLSSSDASLAIPPTAAWSVAVSAPPLPAGSLPTFTAIAYNPQTYSLFLSWSPFTPAVGASIAMYQVSALGLTSPSLPATTTSYSLTGLNLDMGIVYYVSITAFDTSFFTTSVQAAFIAGQYTQQVSATSRSTFQTTLGSSSAVSISLSIPAISSLITSTPFTALGLTVNNPSFPAPSSKSKPLSGVAFELQALNYDQVLPTVILTQPVTLTLDLSSFLPTLSSSDFSAIKLFLYSPDSNSLVDASSFCAIPLQSIDSTTGILTVNLCHLSQFAAYIYRPPSAHPNGLTGGEVAAIIVCALGAVVVAAYFAYKYYWIPHQASKGKLLVGKEFGGTYSTMGEDSRL